MSKIDTIQISGSSYDIQDSAATTALGGLKLVKLNQKKYDALAPNYDPNTLYVVTPPFEGKWLAIYTGGTTSSAACDASSAITQNEITLTDLVGLEIGDCVTSIGNSAFTGCISLTSLDIPDNVASIGSGMCSGCTSLTNCTIGTGVTTISGNAFRWCSGMTSCNIPSGVTSIESYAFSQCRSLTGVTIPDSVTSIGRSFENCHSLTSLTIPSGVTSITANAFRDCTGLTSVTVEAVSPPTIGNNVFYNTNNCPIYVPSGSVDTYKAADKWSDYSSRIQAIS